MLEEKSKQESVAAGPSDASKKTTFPTAFWAQEGGVSEARAASPPICDGLDADILKHQKRPAESIFHLLPPPPQFRKSTSGYVPFASLLHWSASVAIITSIDTNVHTCSPF